jgi:hypothetical protein
MLATPGRPSVVRHHLAAHGARTEVELFGPSLAVAQADGGGVPAVDGWAPAIDLPCMPLARPQVPSDIVARLRAVCRALPETREEAAWVGTRWRVRDKTFAHVLMIAGGKPAAYAQAARTDGPACVVTFRTLDRQFDPVDFEAPPFFRPVWFPNIVGALLDEATDWDQLAAFLEVSYRVMAPKKLAEMLNGAAR